LESKKTTAVFILIIVVGVPLLLLILSALTPWSKLFVFFYGTIFAVTEEDDNQESIRCSVHENHNKYMKNRWLLSDNISSYEDIPEAELENLSSEAKDWLRSEMMHEYDPIEYSELSKGEQNLFRRSINNSTVFNETNAFWREDPTDLNFVLRNGTVYRCDILKPNRGA
jgi:hypothetical protein